MREPHFALSNRPSAPKHGGNAKAGPGVRTGLCVAAVLQVHGQAGDTLPGRSGTSYGP